MPYAKDKEIKEPELSTEDVFDNEDLQQQVENEYQLAYSFLEPRITEWHARLKLYNNQRRDKKSVGDPLLFTIHQTVLASLYSDRLMADWMARNEGDEEVAENLNALAQFDYDDMGKDELDYFWDWDSTFFGRGIVGLYEFVRDPKQNIFLPMPELFDPMVFLRDERAVGINGDRQGRGAARYFGRVMRMTKRDMEAAKFQEIDEVEKGIDTKSLVELGRQARSEAQGNQYDKFKSQALLGENEEFEVLEWFTYFQGKKVRTFWANNRKKLCRFDEIKGDKWPCIDRVIYPISHDWDGVSIPDLVEDKQRARAVAQNLGLQMMQADLYPMYIYDTNRIKNKNDLNFDFNKFVGVDGPTQNAILPLVKSTADRGLLNFIFTVLDVAAQKATATPEIQQGALSTEKRTLGEINLVASQSDTRYSLSAKIFGWSEKRFWQQWYQMYKEYFADDIDEKVISITGAFGPKWRPLTKKEIVGTQDPNIRIESTVLAQAKRLEERALLTQYFGLAMQEPTTNRRYALRKLGRASGLDKEELERLYPPTVDERIAEKENDKLNNNELVPVLASDDHQTHLEIHSKAADTEATTNHIGAHEDMLSVKKTNPELFPQDQPQPEIDAPGLNLSISGQRPGEAPQAQAGLPAAE